MSEETDSSPAASSVFTRLSTVTRRMEPTLENSMRELTRITSSTTSFTKLRTSGAGVMKLSRITSSSFFSGMCERTLRPIMRSTSSASPDFELVDAKLVGGE
uniref:Uncharacterized protein n=1 Tax=Arabidopsis thaliana TaxID=3702 RepID=Q0WQ39_ARATH|nr:hypothetical protein [Arabidopsis thaliana]